VQRELVERAARGDQEAFEGLVRLSANRLFAIDAVLAHARTHPRRGDPLAALRRDPMGSGFGLGRMIAPLPLVAALGLLLVAAVGGAAVGGWFDRDRAVVPPVVSPAPSVVPSAAPTPVAAATTRSFHVDLIEHLGNDASIDITDTSGTVVDAQSGDPGDGVDVPTDKVQVENDPGDPATVVLTWSGGTCDTTHELVIDADGRTLALSRPTCEGDSLGGVGHVLRLTFDGPAPAGEFSATLETVAP
jgi:hypothetical protein